MNPLPQPAPVLIVHDRRVSVQTTPVEHVLPDHYLSLSLQGQGFWRNGSAEIRLDDRQLISFLPAGDTEVYLMTGAIENWYVGFRWPELAVRAVSAMDLALSIGQSMQRAPRWKLLDPASAAALAEAFQAVRAAMAREDFSGRVLGSAQLMRLFSLYLDLPSGHDAAPGHRALVRFCELLRKNIYKDAAIEELAAELDISENHIRRLFQRRFGMNPVEYRTGLRLARGRELLISTNLSIKEVALQSGFPDARYFARVFRRKFGVAPREIIRRFQTVG